MKNRLMLICLALFFALGCKKEDKGPMLITDPCLIDNSFTIHHQYPIISHPVVNPNNPDEIAFLRDKFFSTCCNQELMVFNMKTRELKSIHSGVFNSFDWAINGWILFLDNSTAQISKIQPTGDSLTQLTFYGFHSDPIWNEEGTAYMCRFSSPDFDSAALRIMSPSGNILREFNGSGFGYSTWYNDSLVTILINDPFTGNAAIALFSLNDYTTFFPFIASIAIKEAGGYRFSDLVYVNKMVVTSQLGVFITDYSSLAQPVSNRIKQNCPQLGYGYPTAVRQTQQVIIERFEYEITGEKEAIRNTRFVRMNLDGTNEEVIEIPGQ